MPAVVNCDPASSIGAFSAQLNGNLSGLDPVAYSDNWQTPTVVGADGGPQTITHNNFDIQPGLTVEDVTTGSFGSAAGWINLDDGSPGVYTHTISFSTPVTNLTIEFGNFASGSTITNISPAFTSFSGDGSASGGNTVLSPTDNTFATVLNFAGPVSSISYTWDAPSGNLGMQSNITFDALPADAYQYFYSWGTTPGGPYATGTIFAGDNADQDPTDTPSATAFFLLPLTQYYYILEVRDRFNNPVAQSGECSFITLAPTPRAFCDGAILVGMTDAVLTGHSEDASLGQFYEFRYGTTPGGPYDHSTPQIAADGSSPEVFVQPVSPLQEDTVYYYVVVILDALQHVIVTSLETGPECDFLTGNGESWCGGLFSTDDCDLVDPGNGEPYFNCNQI